MNSIKKLEENVTSFLTEIADHYGIPKSEVVSTLREVNFYCLYQTLCREAMPVFAFRADRKMETCCVSAERNCSLATRSICTVKQIWLLRMRA